MLRPRRGGRRCADDRHNSLGYATKRKTFRARCPNFSDRTSATLGPRAVRSPQFNHHRVGIIQTISERIADPRRADRIRYSIDELIRERVFAMAIGCSAQDDVDRLAHDPAFRAAVWNRSGDQVIHERLASQPTQSRLIDILTRSTGNLEALRDGLSESVQRHVMASGGRRVRQATIDIDSFPIEVHGKQYGSSYNGYYGKSVYHPLIASLSVGGDYDSTRVGDRLGNGFIHATLRQGQVHTAKGMKRFVDRVDAKAHDIAQHVDYRLDAGYTIGSVMDALTAKKQRFVGRLKANAKLDALAAEYLSRPPGRQWGDRRASIVPQL